MHSNRMSAIVLFNQQRIRDRNNRKALEEAFRKADTNKDGRLSVDEVFGIYKDHGIEVTREEVQRMVEAADKDGTGLLTEKEFVDSQQSGEAIQVMEDKDDKTEKAAAPPRDAGKQAELAFKLYDKDRDGYITKAEMEKLSKNLNKDQIEKVFARFDKDGDGRLSLAEFRKMMNKTD